LTTQLPAVPHTADTSTDALPQRWERLLSLSGVAFAPFFVVGWVTSVANNPHYTAPDREWTKWAHDNELKGRISAFAMLLAAFIFLYFIAGIRSALESAESTARGSVQFARVAFAGGLTGIVGTTMAFVSIANASSEGANANPVVSRAVTTGTAGPFLVGAMGFAAFLMAVGVLTLRSGVFARWTGIVALIGAGCFLITFLTALNNTGNGSIFGYAFFPALLSLVTWTIATSLTKHRAVAAAARVGGAVGKRPK
jgi:succinate dehydrogenase/fumarate reductase cytochrome b subunit